MATLFFLAAITLAAVLSLLIFVGSISFSFFKWLWKVCDKPIDDFIPQQPRPAS